MTIVFFLFGAIVASFMGVVAGRLSTGQSILTGRSRCDVCGAVLSPSSLIPILSYALRGGRARCCGARLSLSAPLSELVLGALFALAYARIGFSFALPFVLIALAALTGLVLYDLAHQILPPVLLAPFVGAAAFAGYFAAPSPVSFATSGEVAFAIGAFLAVIHIASRGRAMGLADAPLAFGLALLTGDLAFSGFVYAFWIGAAVGIILLVRRPRGSRMGIEVPFAPFLAAGFLLAYFTQWNLITLLTGLR